MARRGAGVVALTLLAALVTGGSAPALAQAVAPPPAPAPAPAPALTEYPIGFVELLDDPRYDADYAYNMVPVRPLGRPFPGAELGIFDAVQIGRAINTEFSLRHAEGQTVDELAAAVTEFLGEGVHFVLTDLPADALLDLSARFEGQPVTFLNVAASEDRLRGEDCRFNIIHTIPSVRMYTDAVVQFLVFHRWPNILVLQGPAPEDEATVAALRNSANFFGARIIDVRPFVLGTDPRDREQNNVALITADGNYDVVYIADADGDFARYVAYEVNHPRPTVGSAGLVAEAWHWSWERSGAPQVNARFEDIAGRRMGDSDFAAWAAVRAITGSVLRSQSTEYEAVRDYMLSVRMNLDGAKGFPLNVRPWDHQLRQAMLLATGNAVLQLAPLEGFLHQTNDLDTLGVDEPQSVCRF